MWKDRIRIHKTGARDGGEAEEPADRGHQPPHLPGEDEGVGQGGGRGKGTSTTKSTTNFEMSLCRV